MTERFTTLDDVRKTSDAELASLAYTMPREWAIHFEYRLQHILDRIKGNTRPIGRCTHYAVTIEEQHRGWLHAHCPLRMEKAPDVLTAEGKSHFPDWVEEMVSITTSLPGGGMVAEQKQPTENDPESGIFGLLEKKHMCMPISATDVCRVTANPRSAVIRTRIRGDQRGQRSCCVPSWLNKIKPFMSIS